MEVKKMYTYFHNNYLYSFVEMQRFALEPYRQMALKNKDFYNKYFSGNKYGRTISASFELFERVTRHYNKPEFGIEETQIAGKTKSRQEKNEAGGACGDTTVRLSCRTENRELIWTSISH